MQQAEKDVLLKVNGKFAELWTKSYFFLLGENWK